MAAKYHHVRSHETNAHAFTLDEAIEWLQSQKDNGTPGDALVRVRTRLGSSHMSGSLVKQLAVGWNDPPKQLSPSDDPRHGTY